MDNLNLMIRGQNMNIYDFYKNECDESKRLSSQSGRIEYLTTMRYIIKYCPNKCKILDACAGCGIYAFPLAELGHDVNTGDLIEVNVEKIKKQQAIKPILKEIYLGSILNLSKFEDKSFDMVLNLGSYYHICDKRERLNAIRESLRVLKKGGIYVMAYINRYANYMSHCEEMNEDFGFFERFMKAGHADNNYVFYASSHEMVEDEMNEFNLEPLINVATDGPIFWCEKTVDLMNEDVFQRFLNMHYETCEIMNMAYI